MEIKNQMLQSDFLKGIANLLGDRTHTAIAVKEMLAALLFSLTILNAGKIAVGACGAIPPLVQMLTSESKEGRRDACKALLNLTYVNVNKDIAVGVNAVPILLKLLEDLQGPVAEKVTSILANLSTTRGGRASLLMDGGVPVLVEVVESGSAIARESSAAALLQLAKNNEESKEDMLKEMVLPSLVNLEVTGTPRAKVKAKQLLFLLRNNATSSLQGHEVIDRWSRARLHPSIFS
eukprot:TRINITY_DN6906_c0_g3_i1.p1 TRINITY_DN6906_c0_g3~~TRINITY_DN6906_c0_g3_i1.p1  ORF type:complete len:235 (+),score=80.60 TRINITY_DN6906_c0_g3_i1:1-705(+)